MRPVRSKLWLTFFYLCFWKSTSVDTGYFKCNVNVLHVCIKNTIYLKRLLIVFMNMRIYDTHMPVLVSGDKQHCLCEGDICICIFTLLTDTIVPSHSV